MKNLLTVAFCCAALLIPAAFAQEVEPNDSANLADSIASFAIQGNIGHSGDVDWFVLVGQEGYNPTFTITHAANNDFDFEIYSDGAALGCGLGISSGDSVSCEVPGVCHVKVWSSSGTGSYSISINPGATGTPSDTHEVEPNDSKSLADSVADPVIVAMMGGGDDVDWFVLAGQEGYSPTFTIIHDDANDFDFEIFSDNTSVGRGVGISSGDSVTCNVPGTCYVKVWSCSGTGMYQIVITP